MSSIEDPPLKYIGYTGCYTEPKQADPFGGLGGVPHDESKIGTGIQAMGITKDGKLSYLGGASAGGRVKLQKMNGDKVEDVEYDSLGLSNPSYLQVSKEDKDGKRYLCTATEVDKGNKMYSFVIDPKKDPSTLTLLSTIPIDSSYPCHFGMISNPLGSGGDEDKVLTIVCSYGRDEENAGVSTFLMNNKDSKDSDCVFKIQELIYSGNGSMSNLDRQLSSHAHSTAICPGISNEIFMADLGKDSIVQYQFESAVAIGGKSVVNLKEIGKLGVPLGSGPRSLTFRPNGGDDSFSKRGVIGVVSLEIKASLLLVRRRVHDGCLEILQPPISILPEGWPEDESIAKFNKGRWASDVVWSPCGKFVFAAARLHNSISIFELKHPSSANEDGEMEFSFDLVDRIPTGGQTPRCLCMSPEGDFLLICHQHSHDITCFQIDSSCGKLTMTDKLEHPLAACLKLIPAPKA